MNNKLPFVTKFGYGLAGIGDGASYAFTGTFLMFFLTTVAGISPAAAGMIAALGGIWQTLCSPVVGHISDNTENRRGRRKPYILWFAFPLGVAMALLFTAIEATMPVKILYYGTMTVIFWTAFSFFFIPYLSWGAEITNDYDERTLIRTYAYFFQQGGMVLGMVIPTIVVDWLMTYGLSEKQGWQSVGILVGACSAVSIFSAAMLIVDKVERKNKTEGFIKNTTKKTGLKLKDLLKVVASFVEVIKLRSVRLLIYAAISYLIGYSVYSADRMYFFTFNLGMGAYEISLIMGLITLSGLVFMPFLLFLARRFDKRAVCIGGLTVSAAVMFAMGLMGIETYLGVIVFSVFYTVGSAAYWQLMPAIIYDVCEVDELVSGKKRAGSIASLLALAESGSQAIGFLFLGIVLDLAGFKEAAALQTDRALAWSGYCFSIIPALFIFTAAFMIYRYPVGKKVFNEVLEALAMKEQGEQIDLSKFKTLI